MALLGSGLIHVQPARRRYLLAALRRAWSLQQTPGSTRRHGVRR